jgi:hypothetical protein
LISISHRVELVVSQKRKAEDEEEDFWPQKRVRLDKNEKNAAVNSNEAAIDNTEESDHESSSDCNDSSHDQVRAAVESKLDPFVFIFVSFCCCFVILISLSDASRTEQQAN